MRSSPRHRFIYPVTATLFAAFVAWAFARTYYFRGSYERTDLSVFLRIHGAIMTGWVLLLVVQSVLVAADQAKWHRRLGFLGAAWALLVMGLGAAATILASAREVRNHTAMEQLQLTITGLELVQVILFGILVFGAVALRRRPDYHKRLMILSIVCMLPSVIPRLPVTFFDSLLSILMVTFLILAVLVGVDTYLGRRLHPAFVAGGGLIVSSLQLGFFAAHTAGWRSFLAAGVA